MFAAVADSVEGFGGLYYDDGGLLTVLLKDPSTLGRQADRIETSMQENQPGRFRVFNWRPSGEIRAARAVGAKYSFRELLDLYRGALKSVVASLEGLVYTDIDERENRIVVGVSDQRARQLTAKRLVSSGIDTSMVEIRTVGAVLPTSLLSDPLRPVPGGARIRQGSASGVSCTHGFNVVKYMGSIYDTVATARYFLTASHCSYSLWSTESSQYYQGGSFYGVERGDPGAFSGAPCMTGKLCRYSEVSLNEFYDDSITADFPRIAYPTSIGDTSFSSYRSVSTSGSTYVGSTVVMVGATSGRRTGTVSNVCADLYPAISPFSNKGILCQGIASYQSLAGDSGAPVVSLLGDGTVSATGINWGNHYNNLGQYVGGVFSPISQVLDELFYGMSGRPFFSPFLY